MTDVLMSPAVYGDVRAAIQIDLTADDIPDQIIEQDQFSGAAERDVWALAAAGTLVLPVRGTVGFNMLITAAVQFTAARLVSSIPQLTGEQFANYRYSRVAMDPTARAAQLVQRGLISIAAALGVEITSLIRAESMVLALGGRGNTTPLAFTVTGGSFMGPF